MEQLDRNETLADGQTLVLDPTKLRLVPNICQDLLRRVEDDSTIWG